MACGEGVLVLSQVQLEGKKRMDADAFLRGCRIEAGNRFADKKGVIVCTDMDILMDFILILPMFC